MGSKIPQTRAIAREGVNAVQSFFESNECVFQEVSQQNDFGKDAYVDIGRDGEVTFLCAALQIKSGESYRSANGDYFIPLDAHATTWRRSTVPVFGLVYDPVDRLIRWIDLTGFLREHPSQEGGSVSVPRDAILSRDSLSEQFARAVERYVESGGRIALNLLTSGPMQLDAVFDAWALGRKDARYLILLRRLLLELQPQAMPRAIHLLAHAGLHPDWIPDPIADQARKSYRWSPAEVAYMIQAAHPGGWGRGTIGQSLDVLLCEDPNRRSTLRSATAILLQAKDNDAASCAAMLALAHAKDAREELTRLVEAYPDLMQDEWFEEVAATVEEWGQLSMY